MFKKTSKQIIFLLFLFLLFTNCQEPSTEEVLPEDSYIESSLTLMNNLKGYWKSSFGDGFEITGDALPQTFFQYDDASKTISFAGYIVGNENDSIENGFITILISSSGSWGKTLGTYYVVRWRNFNLTSSISESSAYKSGGLDSAPTKQKAENEYTSANGYFAYFGDYIKQ